MARRTLLALMTAVCTFLLAIPPAFAGGSVWTVEEDDIHPGDSVRVWATVAWAHNANLGTPDDGPFYAYIRPSGPDGFDFGYEVIPDDATFVAEISVELGPYDDDGVLHGPNHAWFEFEVPGDATGQWSIGHCNDPCTTALGDITWGVFEVTADPPTTTTEHVEPVNSAVSTSQPPARRSTDVAMNAVALASVSDDGRPWLPAIAVAGAAAAAVWLGRRRRHPR